MVKRKKVLVLGAGLAGLRAASVLANRGYEVAVAERAPMAGGCTSSWIDHRDPEKSSIRKGQMQMNFPFYVNLEDFCRKEIEMTRGFSPFTARLPGFFFVDENGRRSHLSDLPRSLAGKVLRFLPAPISAGQILWDFDGLPALGDKLSTLRFHALALLFGDRVVPPFSDDWNFYGFMKHLGFTDNAVKAFRRITYSITNLSDADQVGPKFMHLFYLSYLRDKNILGCRMMNDDCNPAVIDPIVSSLKSRGVAFRFDAAVVAICADSQNTCRGVEIEDRADGVETVCDNCGLLHPSTGRVIFCPACGYRDDRDLIGRPAPKKNFLEADYVISALQPHQLATIFKQPGNHQLRCFPEFRALGQFKGASLTVSRIFLDRKTGGGYNLTGLDRDYYPMNGCMDISGVMRRYEKTSVFDTLSDDDETLKYYPPEVLKSALVDNLHKIFPETRSAKVRKHLLASIFPDVLYHRPCPRLNSRFLPKSSRTPIDNFFFAGDWMDEYELGMEAAVKSGIRAANAVLECDGRNSEAEPILRPTVAPLAVWLQNNPISRFIKKLYEKPYLRQLPPRRG